MAAARHGQIPCDTFLHGFRNWRQPPGRVVWPTSIRCPSGSRCTNNADAYPDDRPHELAGQARRAGWNFPYLVDADQKVGRAYHAACTPDFFLYDSARRLAYRGAFDQSTPGKGKPVTGELLRAAIELTLVGQPVPEPHRPSIGCSIKWRS